MELSEKVAYLLYQWRETNDGPYSREDYLKVAADILGVVHAEEIPDQLVVQIARDRDPNGYDLVELLSDATGRSFGACHLAVHRALDAGLLEYHDITENAIIHSRPTAAGLALLAEPALAPVDPSV
jgi:hypothetical protein